jgi:hypothetical protein
VQLLQNLSKTHGRTGILKKALEYSKIDDE